MRKQMTDRPQTVAERSAEPLADQLGDAVRVHWVRRGVGRERGRLIAMAGNHPVGTGEDQAFGVLARGGFEDIQREVQIKTGDVGPVRPGARVRGQMDHRVGAIAVACPGVAPGGEVGLLDGWVSRVGVEQAERPAEGFRSDAGVWCRYCRPRR